MEEGEETRAKEAERTNVGQREGGRSQTTQSQSGCGGAETASLEEGHICGSGRAEGSRE